MRQEKYFKVKINVRYFNIFPLTPKHFGKNPFLIDYLCKIFCSWRSKKYHDCWLDYLQLFFPPLCTIT